MKKFAMTLLIMVTTSPLFAVTNTTVALQTSSLGFVSTAPFDITADFSEPVTGFGPEDVFVSNGVVVSITGSPCLPNYVIRIQPLRSGPIKIFVPADSVIGSQSGLPNLDSNTLNLSALDPNLRPSSNFDLTKWTLTLPLPLGKRNDAINIGTVTLNGIPEMNSGYSNPPYFYTDPETGAMNFLVPLNGATTPNSDFARTELMENLGVASPTWDLSTFASNTLTASVAIDRVPPIEKRFVIAQIHDKGNTDIYGNTASNSPMLKLYYDGDVLDPNKQPCNGCVYAQIRITPAQSNFLKIVNLVRDIPLNKIFTYRLTLLRDGNLTVKINEQSTTIKLNTSKDNRIGWGSQQLYFKAGAYNLEHDTVVGGANRFYALNVSHVK